MKYSEINRLEKLIRRLHCKTLPYDVEREIFKFRKPGYDYLFKIVDESTLSEDQVANILRTLCAMRGHGEIELFINKLFSLVEDERLKVSLTASYLLEFLLQMKENLDYLDIPLEREQLMRFINK
ncbi:hypothetical protein NIES267_68510 [Calothrix parasitica NIES-267]|uniref:Uncharacterized protein n=1 Tax=Calothrix parasitica NIES-267 TaxID=1973488 RepID=A0A1Z4M1H5_9CYAN|nr:hypothetical protein NIES267_68510 [Calothrix parasitica NIES-267]